MVERDNLVQGFDPNNKLYIVLPDVMRDYMDSYRLQVLKHPDMVVFVSLKDLNPEPNNYYGDD